MTKMTKPGDFVSPPWRKDSVDETMIGGNEDDDYARASRDAQLMRQDRHRATRMQGPLHTIGSFAWSLRNQQEANKWLVQQWRHDHKDNFVSEDKILIDKKYEYIKSNYLHLKKSVKEFSERANVDVPLLLVYDDKLLYATSLLMEPLDEGKMLINPRLLERLKPEELDAVAARIVGYVYEGVPSPRLQIPLLPRLVFDQRQALEKKVDTYALQHVQPAVLISLLTKMSESLRETPEGATEAARYRTRIETIRNNGSTYEERVERRHPDPLDDFIVSQEADPDAARSDWRTKTGDRAEPRKR